METAAIWFLLIAVAIVFLAIALTRMFRKQSKLDSKSHDLNSDNKDGSGVATWIGIDGTGKD